jgi:tRNA(Ile)-lysidine synthase
VVLRARIVSYAVLSRWNSMISDRQTQREDPFILAVKQALNLVLTNNSIFLPRAARLLQSFSGGPDSTALLAALVSFARDHELELHVCHINHGLRGAESEQDEEYCRNICRDWGLPLQVERVNSRGCSEAELRELRYQRLAEVGLQIGSRICATGHTLDDQVETMLFRLLRGTGPSGLLGIPSYRKVGSWLVVVRPMLTLRKADCLAFLERIGVTACSDSSNQNNSYSRNFLRNQILPLLDERFPGFRERMEQLRKVMSADESLLNCLSRDAVLELSGHDKNTWSLDQFNELPLSLRRRVIWDSFHERGIECDFSRIESVLEMVDLDGDAAVSLNDEWEIRLAQGELQWKSRLDKPPDVQVSQFSVPLAQEGLTLIHKLGLAVNVEKFDSPPENVIFPGSQEHELLGDLSRAGELRVRLREEGDQIQPLGMDCMVRLKKFLHTHKSSKTLSFGGRVLVLANESEVLWVPGCGMSQRIAIGNRATHRIQLVKLVRDDTTLC